MEQVAAPQQLAAKERTCAIVNQSDSVEGDFVEGRTVPRLGTASSGMERRAPIAADGAHRAAQAGDGAVSGLVLAVVCVGDGVAVRRVGAVAMGMVGVVDGGLLMEVDGLKFEVERRQWMYQPLISADDD